MHSFSVGCKAQLGIGKMIPLQKIKAFMQLKTSPCIGITKTVIPDAVLVIHSKWQSLRIGKVAIPKMQW